MKLFFKVLAIVFFLALLFLAGFKLWGEHFEVLLSQEACIKWFIEIKPYAWSIGVALLVTDLLLPIPATGIMAALGSVYGFLPGALISTVGSTGAGITGYIIAKYCSKKAIRLLASDAEIERFRSFFDTWGGAAIIISRIVPIMPEVISILAGISGMNTARFFAALLLGTIPTCLLFSYIGHVSSTAPFYGMTAAIVLPLLFWPIFLKFAFNKSRY